MRDGGLIKDGYNEDVDKYRKAKTEGKTWLAELEAKEREKTGIKNLKIKYNKVFGYYLEVTNSYKDLVPDYFMRKQTLANAERYITPELKELEDLIAEQIQHKYKYAKRLHWRQGILGAEIIILFIVGFIPQRGNMIATVLVSFACAMQVQSFRKVNGFSYASTMCIGNLRSGTAALSFYLRERRPEQLRQAMYYLGIIVLFAIGAGIGGNLSANYGIHMIWVSCGLLIVSFLLMFLDIEARRSRA